MSLTLSSPKLPTPPLPYTAAANYTLHLAPGLPWTHEWSSRGSLAIGRHEKSDTLPHWVPSQNEKVSYGEVLHQPAGFSGRGAAAFRGIL